MTFGAASVPSHALNYVTCTTEASILVSSNLHDKSLRLSSAKRLVSLKGRRSVSAIRNENDQHECSVGADQSLAISNDQEKEIADPSLYLSKEHAQILGNHGNLLDKLKAIHMHALAMEQWNASRLKLCHRRHVASATNLIHYLAVRSLDVDQIKKDLFSVGLLNLETINPCVIASLSAGIQMLESTSDVRVKDTNTSIMRNKASSNRDFLIGPVQDGTSHIMVTVGEEAIANETFITDILKKGTTVIRINCAHGDPSVWSEIIRRVKISSQMLERRCRILMDLAGPKLRTSKMKAGPCVMKISPKKNAYGDVVNPAQVWVAQRGAGAGPPAPDVVLHVDALSKLEVGDTVRFNDARGKQRSLKISKKYPVFNGVGFMADCTKTCYIENGTKLYIKGEKKRFGCVVDVAPAEAYVRLRVGDLLVITRNDDQHAGSPRVSCACGYLFDSVKPGEPIAFDDGKIWGVIKGASFSEIVVSITHAGPRGSKLGSEKSINIPESKIEYEGLTSKDIRDLEFVGGHADIVGISFVRDVDDIVMVRQEVAKRKLEHLGVVLKIETKEGVRNLPTMLLEAMKMPNPLGVMIARGDLAVECGWESMGDIQEEVLSTCSAAHVPVIWATQVLESLVKSGVPSRAEITDVACGRRASCIMLNKGKHILEAIEILDAILRSSSKVKVKSNHLS